MCSGAKKSLFAVCVTGNSFKLTMHLFVTKRIDRQLKSKQQTKMMLESLQVKRERLFLQFAEEQPAVDNVFLQICQ